MFGKPLSLRGYTRKRLNQGYHPHASIGENPVCFMVMSGAEAKVDSSLGVCCSSVLEASLINGLTVKFFFVRRCRRLGVRKIAENYLREAGLFSRSHSYDVCFGVFAFRVEINGSAGAATCALPERAISFAGIFLP